MDSPGRIRNFAIIAHIDHGKSTLADRLLELTGTVSRRLMQEQILDSNPIERERGITIKLAPVRMHYKILNSKFEIRNKSQISNSNDSNRLGFRNSDLGFADSKQEFVLNLIDTPGHVDFSYEVSRSLAACEGALLVVDATQGVQAQTLAHLHQARVHKLTIIPIINKIDLPNARIGECEEEIRELGFSEREILKVSAKTGENVKKVLEAIIEKIPSPGGNPSGQARALVFSSQYDAHKGVVVFIRVVDGSLRFGSSLRLQFMASNTQVTPIELGYFTPNMSSAAVLTTGEVGYIATGLKDVRLAKVGDTLTTAGKQNISSLPGYREPKPMVYVGLFPVEGSDYSAAREAMERLRLSDSAFTFRPISSLALGNGFHCGFLGLLHAEIVQERILREFGLTMIATAPSVEYLVKLKGAVRGSSFAAPFDKTQDKPPSSAGNMRVTGAGGPPRRGPLVGILGGKPLAGPAGSYLRMTELEKTRRAAPQITIQSAAEFPDPSLVGEVQEPVMNVTIYCPKKYVGAVMQLAQEKRGEYIDLKYQADQAEFSYLIPLSEMIVDFFDQLKSVSEGYASLDYEFFDNQPVKVVKLDILVNKEKVDALSLMVVESAAQRRGNTIVDKLATVLPRQQFSIPVQAAIGGKVIARADVKPFRKDVIQKLYGGDRTRKDKLLEKQKKGKAKMKRIGQVEIPQSAFFEVLKRN